MATLLTRADDSASPAPTADPGGGRRGVDAGLSPVVHRARLVTVCLGFLGLALSQQPGRILADTKLDLAVDPAGFLARALHLWEPLGFAGQVQNQAYGYLFPMGPFFALGQTAGVPMWIVQRLWIALLLSVAFLGVVTLARQLRIGTPGAHIVAGLAYALAPRMLTGLGATSVEVIPMALAPWVLVPLVVGARGGSPRRAAALSGLAVFCVGGVNAVATAAVLPLAALFLLTRPPGPRRRRLMAWWTAAVALATAWWAGPLLLLGRYSPPFLDHIETAETTTAPTGLLATLRGTTHWVAYLAGAQGPAWPTGYALATDTLLVVATVVLAGAGLLGLARSTFPDRGWLVLGVLTGIALVTLGHLGPVQGLFAEPLHTALDGVLAPLRNVHKWDPVLRIPLALGVAHLCGAWGLRARRPGRAGVLARTGTGLLVLALVAVVSPAVATRLAPPTGFEGVPGYWEETADWLADAQPSGRALLLPASLFGTYIWGNPADEPLQPLADSPWEVRSGIPLTPPAHIRMLDAVEDRLSRGEGSEGLTRYLARAGISHLVVRNDLDAGAVGATRSILVQEALRESPGIRRVASFGPPVPGDTALFGRVLDAYLLQPRPAVEVYAVSAPAPRAYTSPLAGAVSVAGGPDTVLALEERGLLSGRPALLAEEGAAPAAVTMIGDAQMRRERGYGRILGGVSAGLTEADPRRLDGGARDYLYPGWELGESVVRYEGASVSASSSASDPDSVGGARPAAHPGAALDGDPSTAWRPAAGWSVAPEWWRVDVERRIRTDEIMVRLADDPDSEPPTGVTIATDRGEVTVALADSGEPQWLPLPPGPTRSITIRAVGGAVGGPPNALALAEVAVPGLRVTRTVVTPRTDRPVAAYAFDAANPAAGGCVPEAGGRPRCAAALAHGAEEAGGLDRVFTVGRPAGYDMAVTAVPRPGEALDELIAGIARPWGPVVTASSSAVPDPRGTVGAAFDGDPATAWVAASSDTEPTVTLAWGGPVTVDRIRLVTPPDLAASLPTSVTVDDGGLQETVSLDDTGTAQFPPMTIDRLTLSFPQQQELRSFDPYTRAVTPLGVGIGELQISGAPAGDPAEVVELPCGRGPVVTVDGERRETSLRTTLAGLRSLEPVALRFCADASTGRLAAGEHRFAARSTDTFAVTSATLTRAGGGMGPERAGRTPAELERWEAEHRRVRIAARDEPALLVVPENVNPGWVATLDGRVLESRTVDGWQQGYVVPAGAAGVVELDFGPGTAYRAFLAGGAVAVLVLLGLVLVPARGAVPPPTGRRRRTSAGAAVAAVAATAFLGGGAGLALLAGAAGIGWAARARRIRVLRGLAAAALLAALAVWVVVPGPAGDAGSQVLVLAALATVTAPLLFVARSAGTRSRHRRTGRSTRK